MTALNAATADARQSAPYQWLTRYPKGVDWHRKFTPAPLYELLDDGSGQVWHPAPAPTSWARY